MNLKVIPLILRLDTGNVYKHIRINVSTPQISREFCMRTHCTVYTDVLYGPLRVSKVK